MRLSRFQRRMVVSMFVRVSGIPPVHRRTRLVARGPVCTALGSCCWMTSILERCSVWEESGEEQDALVQPQSSHHPSAAWACGALTRQCGMSNLAVRRRLERDLKSQVLRPLISGRGGTLWRPRQRVAASNCRPSSGAPRSTCGHPGGNFGWSSAPLGIAAGPPAALWRRGALAPLSPARSLQARRTS